MKAIRQKEGKKLSDLAIKRDERFKKLHKKLLDFNREATKRGMTYGQLQRWQTCYMMQAEYGNSFKDFLRWLDEKIL